MPAYLLRLGLCCYLALQNLFGNLLFTLLVPAPGFSAPYVVVQGSPVPSIFLKVLCTAFLVSSTVPWTDLLISYSCLFEVYVTGTLSGSLGGFLVLEDWQVRVFGKSGIVDRPSDRLYVRTIPQYGYMNRRYRYIPYYSRAIMAHYR